MRFSQRIGAKPIKNVLQINSMDDDLKNALWNAFFIYFIENDKEPWIEGSKFKLFYQFFLWHEFFKLPIDEINRHIPTIHKFIRERFFNAEWFEVYDFIEFVAGIPDDSFPVKIRDFKGFCNDAMKKELSGYRFIDDKIVPITDENELQEIEEAIKKPQGNKLSAVHTHLKASLSKLSDRKNPDYRNSIKESISAIEAISKIISRKPNACLDDALKVLEDKIGLHGALKKGFSSLYGYTSDAEGIRHALLAEPNVDFEDAKYMLVSCSAFINYLIMKANKVGIEFSGRP